MRLIKAFRIVIYILVISILTIIAVEFTLRLLGYAYSSPHIMYDKYCYWRMAPNQRMQMIDDYGNPITFTINSLGARNKGFSVKKPLGERRILCVGDSYTYGWGVNDTQTYPAHLQNLIEEYSLNIKVINFGCNGHTILHETDFIKKYGLSFQPDYIIVETTLHTDFSDIDELEYNLGYMPAPGYNLIKYFIRKTAIGNIMLKYWSSQKVKDIIAQRNEPHAQAKVVSPEQNSQEIRGNTKTPLDTYIAKLDELVALADERNLRIIYVIMPFRRQKLDEYEIEAKYIGNKFMSAGQFYEFIKNRYRNKITVIELFSYFNSQDLFLSDWHLNSQGNKLAAEIIYDEIKKIENNG